MARRRSIDLVCATLLVILPVAALAQPPSYYTVRPAGFGMRAAALAEASSADAADVTGMFWNPGCLSFIRHPGFILTHMVDVETHLQIEQVSGSAYHASGLAIGVNGTLAHAGSYTPDGGPAVGLGLTGVDVAASYLLLPTLSVGMLAGVRWIRLAGEKGTTGWGTVGIFYSPSPGISYGMSYGARRGLTYWYANAQSGVEWEPDVLQALEIGATMSYPARAQVPTVVLSLTTQKFFPGVSLFSTKGGIEVYPLRIVSLRVGFKVGTVERVARYGVGLHLGGVRVDLAYAPTRVEQRFGGISVKVDL